jgi:signal transduction histidine kinase
VTFTTGSSEDRFADALAHQLKNPTAAIQAASTNLRQNLRALFEEMSAGLGHPLAAFLARTLDNPAPVPATGLMPEDRLLVIAARLASEGVGGDLQSAASRLARGGWDTWMSDIAPLLRDDTGRRLDLLETTARLRSNLASLDASAERVRGLAGAMRVLTARTPPDSTADPAGSLRQAVEDARAALPEGVELSARIEPLPTVRGRADLLREAWSNLLANAGQAVGASGRIQVEAAACADGVGAAHAVVRIVDDGPGIAAELLPRIFEPFFTTRAVDGGTGLGLALARRIVEATGGRLIVESKPGLTCFEATMPALAVMAAAR